MRLSLIELASDMYSVECLFKEKQPQMQKDSDKDKRRIIRLGKSAVHLETNGLLSCLFANRIKLSELKAFVTKTPVI